MPTSTKVVLGGRWLREFGSPPAGGVSKVVLVPVTVGSVSIPQVTSQTPVTPPSVADFYLRSGGAGSQTGLTWGNAFASFAQAAAAVPDGSTVLVYPEAYTINTPVAYSGKAILWEGPPRIAGQLEGTTGNVYITGNAARAFDLSGVADGGGFRHFAFDLDDFSNELIRMSGHTNLLLDNCYSKGASNSVTKNVPFLSLVGSNPVDGLTMYDCDTHSGYLLEATGLTAGTSAKNFTLQANDAQKACNASDSACFFSAPQFNLQGGANFDGLYIQGGYLETGQQQIVVNMTGVSGTREVTLGVIGFERSSYPTVRLTACDVTISHDGGRYSANGGYSGTNTVGGFVACAPYRLAGDLVPGTQ